MRFFMDVIEKAGGDKPPAGFSPTPSSKKGGYRKRSGSGYVYWYPDGKGVRAHDLGDEEMAGMRKRGMMEENPPGKGEQKPDKAEARKKAVAAVQGAEPGATVQAPDGQTYKKQKDGSWASGKVRVSEEALVSMYGKPGAKEMGRAFLEGALPGEDPHWRAKFHDERSPKRKAADDAKAKAKEALDDHEAEVERLTAEAVAAVVKDAGPAKLSDSRLASIENAVKARLSELAGGDGEEPEPELESRKGKRQRKAPSAAPGEEPPKQKGAAARNLGKAALFALDFLKAKGPHKYTRRVPTGDPKRPWRYYYSESSLARDLTEGETVNLHGGHTVTVRKVDGNKVELEHSGFKSPITMTHEEWRRDMAHLYRERYVAWAEKRARQSANAVLRHVPKSMLAELKGDTDEERFADLKKRAPKVYAKLHKAFGRSGVKPHQAKGIIDEALRKRGWSPEARAALIGGPLTSDGAWAAKNYRQVADAATNLAAGEPVGVGHVGAARELMRPGKSGSFAEEFVQLAKEAEKEADKLTKAVASARAAGVDEKTLHVLAESLQNSALQKLTMLAQAFPGLKDKAVDKAQAALLEAQGIAPGPPRKDGAEGVFFVAGEGGKPVALKAQYRLVEAGDAVASHDPVSFAPREGYPEGLQERIYHRDKTEQNKVIRNAQRMEPAFVVNTNPDALNGPPVTDANGIVLGGNSRTMSIQRVYAEGGEKAKQLKQYMVDHAHEVGLRREDVEAMENPILTRVIDTEGHDENLLVRQMNESFMGAMDPRTMQVAMGRRLSDEALRSLADSMEDGQTLRAFLGSPTSTAFVGHMSKAGIIDERNENAYTREVGSGNNKRRELNEDGKTLVERILVGRLVGDPDVLSNLPPSLVGSVARAVPHMIQAEAHGEGFNLRDDFYHALHAYGELHAKGQIPRSKGKKLEAELASLKAASDLTRWVKADDKLSAEEKMEASLHPAFRDGSRANAIFDTLIKRSGPQQMASTFQEYARMASHNAENQGGLDLGGGGGKKDPLTVFRHSIEAATNKEARAEAQAAEEKRLAAERKERDAGQSDLLAASYRPTATFAKGLLAGLRRPS